MLVVTTGNSAFVRVKICVDVCVCVSNWVKVTGLRVKIPPQVITRFAHLETEVAEEGG